MKLIKEREWPKADDGLPPAAELLYISDNLEELKRVARQRAGLPECEEPAWVGDLGRLENGHMALEIGEDLRYIIRH